MIGVINKVEIARNKIDLGKNQVTGIDKRPKTIITTAEEKVKENIAL